MCSGKSAAEIAQSLLGWLTPMAYTAYQSTELEKQKMISISGGCSTSLPFASWEWIDDAARFILCQS
jgi:hypothetical protein